MYFSGQICYFRATTKWSDFYTKMQHFLVIDLKLVQSLSTHCSKTSSWHNPYIGWLKCTRISFQKAYFARHSRKRDYFWPFWKKYENCQKKIPFVFRALNQNSDSYKSFLSMLATFCMSQNVDLEPWKRMGIIFDIFYFSSQKHRMAQKLSKELNI